MELQKAQAKVSAKKAAELEFKVNEYVKKQTELGKKPSISEVKQKFGISLKQAQLVTKAIPEPVKIKPTKTADKTSFIKQANKEKNVFKVDTQPQSRELAIAPFKSKEFNKSFQNLSIADRNRIASYVFYKQTKKNVLP